MISNDAYEHKDMAWFFKNNTKSKIIKIQNHQSCMFTTSKILCKINEKSKWAHPNINRGCVFLVLFF